MRLRIFSLVYYIWSTHGIKAINNTKIENKTFYSNMKLEDINAAIEKYSQNDETKPERCVIPRFSVVFFNIFETTGVIPSESSLSAIYHDYTLGQVKYNLHRSVRNLQLAATLMESEVELPQIALSAGSADIVLGGMPLAIYLNQAQFDETPQEEKEACSAIVLENWKDNTEVRNGIFLFKDISATMLNVAQKLREMAENQEDADAADTADTSGTAGE